jgi:hypothetical protein
MDGNGRKRPVRGAGNGTRGNDSFLSWLREPGNPSDRQRWLAWAAMVSSMATAEKPVRQRWHPTFTALRILSHTYGEEDTNALSQILKRARHRTPAALPLRAPATKEHKGFGRVLRSPCCFGLAAF